MAAKSDDTPGAAPVPIYWAARGSNRGRPKLKLLGSLRGAGALVWVGGEVAVAYELDIFGSGEARSATATLEGDFSVLPRPVEGADCSPITGARLRLEKGRELAIDLATLEPDLAAVEVYLSASDADLLP